MDLLRFQPRFFHNFDVSTHKFTLLVGLERFERFEMVVELVEEVFVFCWYLWVVSLDDMCYWHW